MRDSLKSAQAPSFHFHERSKQVPKLTRTCWLICFTLFRDLEALFPPTDKENKCSFAELSLLKFPDFDSARSVFRNNMERIRDGELRKQIVELVRKLFQTRNIDKIVAIGGGGLVNPSRPEGVSTLQVHTQHALLLVMRDVWKEIHPNRELKIFIQDLCYHGLDEIVAASEGMQVVNGSMGHQMGWALLDESTFLVDLRTNFPIIRLTFEITRPAAILCPFRIDDDILRDEKTYSVTLERDGKKLIDVPTPGM